MIEERGKGAKGQRGKGATVRCLLHSVHLHLCAFVPSFLCAFLHLSSAPLSLCSSAPPTSRSTARSPFDRIILNGENNNAVMEVSPLGLPNRIVPQKPAPEERLYFHLVDQPDKTYAVPWQEIAKVELFEQILLDEAMQLAARGKGDVAYDYFRFLFAKYPKLAGLESAYGDFLYEEAKKARRDNNLPAALAMLRELHDRQPARPGSGQSLGADHRQAHRTVRRRAGLSGRAAVVDESRRDVSPGTDRGSVAVATEAVLRGLCSRRPRGLRGRRLRQSGRSGPPSRPGLAGIARCEELAQALHQKYPRVVVGVSVPAAGIDPQRIDDWASHRSGRLVHRRAGRFAAPGAQGGRYVCPVGSAGLDPKGQQIAVKLSPGLRSGRTGRARSQATTSPGGCWR